MVREIVRVFPVTYFMISHAAFMRRGRRTCVVHMHTFYIAYTQTIVPSKIRRSQLLCQNSVGMSCFTNMTKTAVWCSVVDPTGLGWTKTRCQELCWHQNNTCQYFVFCMTTRNVSFVKQCDTTMPLPFHSFKKKVTTHVPTSTNIQRDGTCP